MNIPEQYYPWAVFPLIILLILTSFPSLSSFWWLMYFLPYLRLLQISWPSARAFFWGAWLLIIEAASALLLSDTEHLLKAAGAEGAGYRHLKFYSLRQKLPSSYNVCYMKCMKQIYSAHTQHNPYWYSKARIKWLCISPFFMGTNME